ncbi:hypothetical protein MLD38_014263 [Melastoma candidum]|uniref:Uncharacterized protein n=1 Tax=Melastoma candidum TaxID=119954 RepID=A0ACB9RC71_9MYRT|nr:hypothetical protein MLD38_014263 [Melastoma candidum]
MAMRMENLSDEKSYDQGPAVSVPHFGRSYSGWWNSNEPQAGQPLPKASDSKTNNHAAQLLHQARHLGLQLPEPESSSTLSPGQSCQEMSVMGGANSQEQSLSPESGQDENCGRSIEAENKPLFLFGSSEVVFGNPQADQTNPPVRVSYPLAGDPYFGGGFVSAYGPQALLQGSQAAGVASARVPLPFTFAEDGPIFVNAKQYHGILRRRQSRAKLEAQNKVVKARKPYLHESRHRHALNRVRGSGGRFLSTKKLQETNPSSGNSCITDTKMGKGLGRGSGEELYGGSDDDDDGGFYGNNRPVTGGGKSSLALY